MLQEDMLLIWRERVYITAFITTCPSELSFHSLTSLMQNVVDQTAEESSNWRSKWLHTVHAAESRGHL